MTLAPPWDRHDTRGVSARDFITNHRPLAWLAGAAGLLVVAVVMLAVRVSHSRAPEIGSPTSSLSPSSSTPAPPPSDPAPLPDFEVKPVSTSEGDANWYEVPANSLPQRRAWPGEMTAASNRLPRDAYVRVRRIDGKGDPEKTVVVRITDDGVGRKSTLIDLNREAAEALGMVKTGQVRVRVEVLALKNASTDKPVEKKDAAPAAPKASELTDQPAASEKQEKEAAQAKTGGSVP